MRRGEGGVEERARRGRCAMIASQRMHQPCPAVEIQKLPVYWAAPLTLPSPPLPLPSPLPGSPSPASHATGSVPPRMEGIAHAPLPSLPSSPAHCPSLTWRGWRMPQRTPRRVPHPAQGRSCTHLRMHACIGGENEGRFRAGGAYACMRALEVTAGEATAGPSLLAPSGT